MNDRELMEFADGKSLPRGPVNVRREAYEPMLRQLKSVCWENRDGHRWIYWRWIPEEQENGRMDCGYSGVREDGLLPESKEKENCATPRLNNGAGYYQPVLSFEA